MTPTPNETANIIVDKFLQPGGTYQALAADIAAAIEADPGWIPVGERLPEDVLNKLCVDESTGYSVDSEFIAYHCRDGWSDEDGGPIVVTHWRELPEPPAANPEAGRQD